jgi:hypothetical protein
VVIHPNNHAGYYLAPALTLKLIYSPDGQGVGAQAVGYDGVDKRIDVGRRSSGRAPPCRIWLNSSRSTPALLSAKDR